MAAWVFHLAACSVKPGIGTKFIYRGKSEETETKNIKPVDPEMAVKNLSTLLQIYLVGMTTPLFIPPEQARKFFTELRLGKSPGSTLDKLVEDWGNEQMFSDGPDQYWNNLFEETGSFNETFSDYAIKIWDPIEGALSNE